MLGVGVGVELLDADDDVVVGAGAVGRVVRRQVRQQQQHVAELGGESVGRRVELLLLVAQGAALGLELGRLVLPAVAEELADLVGDGADAGAELVALGGAASDIGVELDHAVDLGEVLASAPQPGADHIGLGAEPSDVEHGRRR